MHCECRVAPASDSFRPNFVSAETGKLYVRRGGAYASEDVWFNGGRWMSEEDAVRLELDLRPIAVGSSSAGQP